jgi:ABC-type oligopeptide transport system substrate-binding subunit
MELYRQADNILAQEAPLVPLFYGRQGALIKPWVKRYHSTPLGGMFWKDVVIEPH